ncbi:hypothetical protein CEV31_3890 [Brucella thiophenivorans]|uniref:Uncharacterized protein n=1 Tax=Brucella thiophenivorans TaxID=571255 RepID=A0A256F336_9HYPH|nr:hypothetical protein CEV31_3890 [Brucella thiophenivorans]
MLTLELSPSENMHANPKVLFFAMRVIGIVRRVLVDCYQSIQSLFVSGR